MLQQRCSWPWKKCPTPGSITSCGGGSSCCAQSIATMRIDHVIGVALHHQPRTSGHLDRRAPSRSCVPALARRSAASPHVPTPRVVLARSATHAAERETRQPQLRIGPALLAHSATAASASSVSPRPSSKLPALAPTPRKLKRMVGHPSSCAVRASVVTTLLSMVPPMQRMRMADHHEGRRRGRASGTSTTASSAPALPGSIRRLRHRRAHAHLRSVPRKPSEAELMQ